MSKRRDPPAPERRTPTYQTITGPDPGLAGVTREQAASFPPSSRPDLINRIRLVGDDFLWISDIHVPFHDSEFLAKVVDEVALPWGIRSCILGGDLFDMAVYSKWGSAPEETLEEELETGERLVAALCARFENVVFLLGNHEARFLGKLVQRQIKIKRFIRMFVPRHVENFYATPFCWVEVESKTGTWLCAHQQNASTIAARVGTMIAGRSAMGKHVICGHDHLVGLVRNDAGTHWVVHSGMTARPAKVEYAVANKNTRPVMMQGAVAVRDGVPTLLTPHGDWAAERRRWEGQPAKACRIELAPDADGED